MTGGSPPAGASRVTRLVPLDAALARWLEAVAAAPPRPAAPLDAIGAALAETVRAAAALPPCATALREGWALSAADTVGATGYAPAFLPAAPVWVEAGDPLPPGADAVLPDAALDRQGPLWACLAAAAPGENMRRAGGEVPAGTALAQAGQTVTPALAAALAAAGVAHVSIPRPQASLAAGLDPTAAEVCRALLRPIGEITTGPGPILVEPRGASAPAGPDETPICAALALSPGEGVGLATRGGAAVLRLPRGFGPAVAACLALLRPALDKAGGRAAAAPDLSLPLARKISSRIGWSELALLDVVDGRFAPLATGDVTIAAWARAKAWALIPPESEGAPAGAVLAAFSLRGGPHTPHPGEADPAHSGDLA